MGNDDEKKVIKRSIKEAAIATIMAAFAIALAVCVAGLIFSLPSQ